MSVKEDLFQSIETGLIDKNIFSDKDLRPQLLINDYSKSIKLLNNIVENLRECSSFTFSVAFITKSGLLVLKDVLMELSRRNIHGKILTSDYLFFNEPDALRELMMFENIEARVYTKDAFHIKGYIFEKKDYSTLIIGSSNLTQDALLKNKEWNMMISSLENGELTYDIKEDFNKAWDESDNLTLEYIKKYEEKYNSIKRFDIEKDYYGFKTVSPTKMQINALQRLQDLRNSNETKGLVISATGTGKTYLSAFDIEKVNPNRVLFVVHRANIAKQAMTSYKNVIKNKSMGLLYGKEKEFDKDIVFSTIQTISKDETLRYFDKDDFDYIIIDEVHRSGAKSYLKILNYFNPKFLLGMTATPERTDGYDIYSLFDNNIAFEIRLNDALRDDLLSPFHYFGIADIISESYLVDENTSFNQLASEERVNKIIDSINLYGYSGKKPKGLIFCSRVEESRLLSSMFNERDYKTVSIDGKTPESEREIYMDLLESNDRDNYLDFIFSVDVFNEGIDIQSINMIIMLRPTQSAIIFVQQLGRGLRKYPGKEYLVVLDFIGNYSNNYMIPLALYGDRTYNKDNLRRFIQEGNSSIPGSTTIHFDEISKEKIFEAINTAPFKHLKLLKDEYIKLKNKINKMPMMLDFYEYNHILPFRFINYNKCKSYYDFVVKYFQYNKIMSKRDLYILQYISKELIDTKRLLDLLIMEKMMIEDSISIKVLLDEIKTEWHQLLNLSDIISSINTINGLFVKDVSKYHLEGSLIELKAKHIIRTAYYNDFLEKEVPFKFARDAINFGFQYFINEYYEPENYRKGFYLYKKYGRKDVARILGWKKDFSSTMYGYLLKDNTLPIFVDYIKSDDSQQYQDYFISRNKFNWMSKHYRYLSSREMIAIREQQNNNLFVPLFIKKSNAEGSDFYFIGSLSYDSSVCEMYETEIDHNGQVKPVVNTTFEISDPVKKDLYRYFVKDE